jgi:hypothetical protein
MTEMNRILTGGFFPEAVSVTSIRNICLTGVTKAPVSRHKMPTFGLPKNRHANLASKPTVAWFLAGESIRY